MTERDDDRFRPKVGPPKSRGSAPESKFISRVLKATSKAGGSPRRGPARRGSRSKAKLGRGHVAASLMSRRVDPRARRVIVKTRLVNLKQASPRSLEKHLRYIERDGVAPDGGHGQLYGAETDQADAQAFKERCEGNRHQFRMIVSPEDAAEIGDLKTYTRELMAQMERDLGTKLDWVAVDHWDTDEPHTHIVVRGQDENGRDLIIAGDYIAHGMRGRAVELATQWLGPRTELEIRESLTREVKQERWTSLDRDLQRNASEGVVVVRSDLKDANARFNHGLLVGRLERLSEMGLATKLAPMTYRLSPQIEPTLRAMGERGDIIRTMQRAMGTQPREYAVFDHARAETGLVGRIAAKGLADELTERGYLVLDGLDGRAHYVQLTERADFTELPMGSIVEVRPGAEPKKSDRTIQEVAENGIYRTERHLSIAQQRMRGDVDPQAYVQSHVRRLEALRRAGIVERLQDGVWRIPPDFESRARQYDRARADGAQVELRSHLTVEQQRRVVGATWLDAQLVQGSSALATQGFAAEVRSALAARSDFLIDQGLAERRGQRVVYARNLLSVLRTRELESTAKTIASETGLAHRPVRDGHVVAGTYRRTLSLASGRFAMLDDATGFSLVPWRPVLEQRLGQPMSATVRGDWVSFDFGRARGLSR